MATTLPTRRIGGHSDHSRGVLRRLLAGAIDARQRQARRQVNALLSEFDEAILATFGYARHVVDERCRGPLPL